MTDYIGGRVKRIIDRGTFELEIHYREKENLNTYGATEVVKLVDHRFSDLDREGRRLSRSELKHFLESKYVILRVIGRDGDDRILAYVSKVTLEETKE